MGAPAVIALITAVEAYNGYFEMYRRFAPYDDEGYIMMTVKQFLEGHRLYSEIFSQYGPFYYFYKWGLHGLTRLPVDHDSTRFFALIVWVATACVLAGAIYRSTKSVTLAACVQFMVFLILRTSTQEPGHPIDICALLLATGMLLCCLVTDAGAPGPVLAGFGAVFAAILLTKINLGAFWGLAIGVSLLLFGRQFFFRRVLSIGAAAFAALLPFGLMRAYLGQPAIQDLAWIVAFSFLATFACAYRRTFEIFDWLSYGIVVASSAIVAAIVMLWVSLHSTSTFDVVKAVLIDPWRWVGTFVLISPVRHPGVVCAAAGAGASLILARRFSSTSRVPDWVWRIVLLFKGAFGLAVFGCGLVFFARSVFPSEFFLSYGTPFVFLTLLPNPGKAVQRLPFFRVSWCFIAIIQTLQSYPVAGSDAAFSVFPIVGVAALCVWDCFKELSRFSRTIADSRFLPTLSRGAVVLSLVALFIAGERPVRAEYAANVPLALPGAQRIRLPAETSARFRHLAADIEERSDVFIGLPGLNSFYFWTHTNPPTCRNVGLWMTALNAADQRGIISVLEQHPRAAVLYSPELVRFWAHGKSVEHSELVDYIFANFKTVDSLPQGHDYWRDSYQLLVRNEVANSNARGGMDNVAIERK